MLKKYIELPGDKNWNIGMWSEDNNHPYPILIGEIVDGKLIISEPEYLVGYSGFKASTFAEIDTDKPALTYEEYKDMFPNPGRGWSGDIYANIAKVEASFRKEE